MKRRLVTLVAVTLSSFVVGLGTAAETRLAYAATITVTTTADELNDDGDCSLREAVQAANTDAAVDACSAGSGADTIVVPPGTYLLTIAGRNEHANAAGDLDITSDLTISGAGAAASVVQAGINFVTFHPVDRVLQVFAGADVKISGLTIQGGEVAPVPFGGVEFAGGGIANGGSLELIDSVVRDNFAAVGGGISNGGTLTLTRSTIRSNLAGGPDGGSGGGMNNGGSATLIDSTVSGNTLVSPDGISIGNGILNTGALTLVGSTVSGNGGTPGGGIFNVPVSAGSSVTLTNSTVSGNEGGGVINSAYSSTATLTLSNATLADGFSSNEFGGAVTVNSKNSIISTCSGVLTSQGYNLLQSSSGCTVSGDPAGNVIDADPLLGPLADNGGPTATHALPAGSPAIDAGSPDCPPPAGDQRGVARPQGTACDIGAFEVASVGGPPTPIGGIGLLPSVDGAPLEAEGASGRSASVVAGAVAAVAIGALWLRGAAWYARRRQG